MRGYGNHLIVKEIKEKIKMSSGLTVDSDKQRDVRYRKGEVFDSPKEFYIGTIPVPSNLEKGDVVLYDVAGAYTQRGKDGEEYKIVRFDSLVAVM